MTEDELARLQLLAAIEGNSKYWSGEVKMHGATLLVDRLKSNV